MTERQYNISLIMKLAEARAISKAESLTVAARVVVSDPNNIELMLAACGGFWKAKPPTDRQLLAWRDPVKVMLAHKFPDITDEKLKLVLAYIPVGKRPKTEKINPTEDKVRELHNAGSTVPEIVKTLGVSRTTAYRIIGPSTSYDTSTNWHDQAINLRNKGLTLRQIATHLGKDYQKIQRFFAKKKIEQ